MNLQTAAHFCKKEFAEEVTLRLGGKRGAGVTDRKQDVDATTPSVTGS